MPQLFAVIRSRGSFWNPILPLEQQDDWQGHADFMNALHAAGVVLLGGPLDGTPDVLLIMRATDSEEIERRLQADSWTQKGLLTVKRFCIGTCALAHSK
jgi:uncharacterized protein YciI